MKTAGQITALVGSILLGVTVSTPTIAGEAKVGDVYLCNSDGNLPSVEVIVGKLETLGDALAGEKMDRVTVEVPLMHVQMRGVSEQPLPEFGHSPFSLESLQKCDANRIRSGENLFGDFEGGYEMWRTAVLDKGAGFFTGNPADVYWQLLGDVGQ